MKFLRSYEDDTVQLIDLATDPGEREDLAAARPAEAGRLRQILDAHLDVGRRG